MAVAERAQHGHPGPEWFIPRSSVVSWVLYDLANTVFSLSIVSLYFSLWVVDAMGGSDRLYGNANSISMALMFFTAPLLGALSDQMPRRMPFLIVSTLLCVGLTLFLGTGGLIPSLILFGLANYFFQAGFIFYDALLPEVSTEENRGRVGGIGVGVGYLGSILAILVGLLLLPENPAPDDYRRVFVLTALLFLGFALPAFFFVRERPRRVAPVGVRSLGRAFTEIGQTVRRAGRYPGLGRFLIGRAFYADAANTLIVFMTIYVTQELGFTTDQAQFLLLATIPSAVVGGFVWGVVVDRLGPKRTLNMVLLLWLFVLALAVAIPVLGLPRELIWVAGSLAGIALGGLWTADRPYMLRLTPPRYLGQFYGLYSMVGRFAAIVGPALWGLIVTTLEWGRPAAVGSLFVLVAIAYLILRGVSDEPRVWGAEDLVEREVPA